MHDHEEASKSPSESTSRDEVLDRLAIRPDAPDREVAHETFLRWAEAPTPEMDGPVPLSRYLEELRAGRPDLLDAYPQVPGHDVPGYREWARVFGREQVPLSRQFVPPAIPAAAAPYVQAGVNLGGFLTAELGVGEVARRIAAALRAASVPFATTTFERTTNRTAVAFRADSSPRFDTNLVCVNADSWGAFAQHVGPAYFAGRHTIGVWFWETSVFPSMFDSAFIGIDEIWAASAYVADVLRRRAPAHVPVVEFPMPIVQPAASARDMRAMLGIAPERPMFVTSFDHHSVAERKNPYGAVRAFREAFADAATGGPVLVLKSINGDRHPAAVSRIEELIGGRDDVLLYDAYLDAADNTALLAQATCVVSLHRAEGFGFNIADAMALGVPVIATAATGSLTFTSPDDGWLVPATDVAVGPDHFPYPAEARWADPDLATAAMHMRSIAADPAGACERAARAQTRVLASFTVECTGAFIRNHVATERTDRERRAAELTHAVAAAASAAAAEQASWPARAGRLKRRVMKFR